MTIQLAIDLQKKIVKKEVESAKLLIQLATSLSIRQIWPKTFAHGACKFSGLLAWDNRFNVKTNTFRCAWFEAGNGECYYLSADELVAFKPEAIIHSTFKQSM